MVLVRLSLLCCLVLAVGCGGGSGPGVPVEGTVQLNNKALEKGEIVLFPSDGKVPLKFDIVDGKFAGRAPPDTYKVQFVALKEMPNPNHDPNTPGSEPTALVNLIPARYGAESNEVAKVTEAGPNKLTYSMKDK